MVPAHSDELKNEVYKLRYQVYCIETGFESLHLHPASIEYDEYDSHSSHYLILHKKTETYAATTRLILPNIDNGEKLFPIEKYTYIDNIELSNNIPRANLAEASRFCVSKEFKRRRNEAGTLTGIESDWVDIFTEKERRVFPHLTIGLLACLINISSKNNIHYWYAVMEPSLARFFLSLGMYFIPIGPIADYHGKRRPYIIKVSELLDGVFKKNLDYWNMMSNKSIFGL